MSTGQGKKRMRGEPVLHKQLKTQCTVWLTPETWEKIKTLAKNKSTSASEIIEQLFQDEDGG